MPLEGFCIIWYVKSWSSISHDPDSKLSQSHVIEPSELANMVLVQSSKAPFNSIYTLLSSCIEKFISSVKGLSSTADIERLKFVEADKTPSETVTCTFKLSPL